MAKRTASSSSTLERGRAAIGQRAWADGYRWLSTADRESPLDPDDLERLATAAYLLGRDEESADLHSRAQQEFARRGDAEQAAKCAFWLGFQLAMSGEVARSAGWLARAERLLVDNALDSAVSGYLLIPAGIRRAFEGDVGGSLALFDQAVGVGMRFGDTALVTMARHGQGRSLVTLGQVTAGMKLLDEVMVAVTSDEISPIAVGPVYCSLLDSCHEILDWRRAQEWTEELSRWWSSQPDLVPFRGQCLVHRAEIKQVQGAWPSAMDEVEHACELLAKPPAHRAAGGAFYQQAELHRLRGEFAKATESYRLASQHGRQPQPGLALLRLAQGQIEVASSAIRRLVEEQHDRPTRARVLAAYAEVMLAANDVTAARQAADRITSLLDIHETPFLRALAAGTSGAVLLAEGNPSAALTALHHAQTAWAEVGAPYEGACVRVLIGLATRALGDEEMARLELDAAREVFERLGARPDVERVARYTSASGSRATVLTAREVEVLGLIATGKTNRAVAQSLRISEKTVARHVSNIFTKLGLSSRAAATAYAYEHKLV